MRRISASTLLARCQTVSISWCEPTVSLAWSLGGELFRLLGREPLGAGEAAGDGFVAVEIAEILRRGRDDHPLRAALLGPAHIHEAETVGLAGEFFEIRLGLRVVGQVVVVADREAEVLFRRGQFRRTRGDKGEGECEEKQQGAAHRGEFGAGKQGAPPAKAKPECGRGPSEVRPRVAGAVISRAWRSDTVA